MLSEDDGNPVPGIQYIALSVRTVGQLPGGRQCGVGERAFARSGSRLIQEMRWFIERQTWLSKTGLLDNREFRKTTFFVSQSDGRDFEQKFQRSHSGCCQPGTIVMRLCLGKSSVKQYERELMVRSERVRPVFGVFDDNWSRMPRKKTTWKYPLAIVAWFVNTKR